MSDKRHALFTIGHTNYSLDAFVALLKQHSIAAVVDVRSQPYSRRLDHFNRESLAAELDSAGIKYVFLGQELGARRDEAECYMDGHAAYQRIANLPKFQEGLARVRRLAARCRIALMCAEKDPLDCHRTILICRQLRDEFQIKHILADGSLEDHAESERRLVRQMGVSRTLFEPNLSAEDLIQQAYDKRAEQIAYRANEEEVPQ